MIRNETELDELLSRPSEADIAAAAALNGDLLIIGAGGKMGPTLALRARRALQQCGAPHRVIAVARFTRAGVVEQLQAAGIEVVTADLLQPGAVAGLPECPNVIFMAAMKFGTTGGEHLTWAMNTYLPGLVAERYRGSRIVAFSTGNVYPLAPAVGGGSTEFTPPNPIGEYAQSALGRERMFEYTSRTCGTPVVLLRLNYANELRYGVLLDIGRKVFERRPVDLRMGAVNVIWQGDANSMCLRSFAHTQSPPLVLNITGPECLSVRYIANEFGRRFGIDPMLDGAEEETALLSNAQRAHRLFGYPSVTPGEMIEWVAAWIGMGGKTFGKPTHFEARNGKF
jgi:nucleoside-diphosphate-sugar epimerase